MSGFYHLEMESSTKQLHLTKDKKNGELPPAIAERLASYSTRDLSAHVDKMFHLGGQPVRYHTAVLALRSNSNVPDELTIWIAGDNEGKAQDRNEKDGIVLDAPPGAAYIDNDAADSSQWEPIRLSQAILSVPIIKVNGIPVSELIACVYHCSFSHHGI